MIRNVTQSCAKAHKSEDLPLISVLSSALDEEPSRERLHQNKTYLALRY